MAADAPRGADRPRVFGPGKIRETIMGTNLIMAVATTPPPGNPGEQMGGGALLMIVILLIISSVKGKK
jgi:hypothetical protein